jgi:hypothetical protein
MHSPLPRVDRIVRPVGAGSRQLGPTRPNVQEHLANWAQSGEPVLGARLGDPHPPRPHILRACSHSCRKRRDRARVPALLSTA